MSAKIIPIYSLRQQIINEQNTLPERIISAIRLIKLLEHKIAYHISPCDRDVEDWEEYCEELKEELQLMQQQMSN